MNLSRWLVPTMVATMAAVLFTGSLAWSQPDAKIIPGVSKKAAAQLQKAADHNAHERQKKADKHFEAAMKLLEYETQKEHKALEAILTKLPEYAAYQKTANVLLKAQKGKPTTKEAKALQGALTKLAEQHRKMFETAAKQVTLPKAKLAADLSRSFPGFSAPKAGTLGTILMNPLKEQATMPPSTAYCMKAPYQTKAVERLANLVTVVNDATADLDKGSIHLYGGSVVAGGGGNQAVVGNYITVPAGFTKLKVTVKTHTRFDMYAYSLLGVSAASADIIVELTGVNDQTQVGTTPLGLVVAPLLWFIDFNGEGDHLVSKTFTIPSTGGEFLLRAGGQSTFWVGAVNGVASATEDTTVTQICVELQK